MSNWISVLERLPETEKDVVCYISGGWSLTGTVMGRYQSGWYYPSSSMHSSEILQNVTHWMLLEPPNTNT